MILLLDNYDSFVYNLYQLIGEINKDIKVIRNDELSVSEILKLNPSKIVLSPGPGRPENAGIMQELILKAYKKMPMLGVCLGHQAIFQTFGGSIDYAKKLMHGKSSRINFNTEAKIFKNLPPISNVARYHSLVGKKETLPYELEIIATTKDGEIMAVMHKDYPIYGVQFHPESILTDYGKEIIKNFLKGG